jgi:hypothetical protein
LCSKPPTSSFLLTTIVEGDTTTPVDVTTLVYEEIKGMDPNIVPEPNPGTSASAASNYVEYEDVKPAARGVDKSEENYHFTLCSAYGVPLETNH